MKREDSEPSSGPLAPIALVGFGAIGSTLFEALKVDPICKVSAVLLPPASATTLPAGVTGVEDAAALAATGPRLAVECAGQAAVEAALPVLLEAGIDCIIASVGALADAGIEARLSQAAKRGGARLLAISGAIGGLDALAAARLAGLDVVRYSGCKPPAAWAGTPAADSHDLFAISSPTVVFRGTAREAARRFPKNANVTAAVALAGVGFDATEVELIADPGSAANVHRLHAKGRFGSLDVAIENRPLPSNLRTSWLAALSLECVVREALGQPARSVASPGSALLLSGV